MSSHWLVSLTKGGYVAEHPNGTEIRLDDATGAVSDGFHTIDELYLHRMLLNAALFRSWTEDWGSGSYDTHKSLRHSDGELCFGSVDPWFIVVAQLPTGQISYHYPAEHWNLFKIPERGRAADFDGHTPEQVTERLKAFLS